MATHSAALAALQAAHDALNAAAADLTIAMALLEDSREASDIYQIATAVETQAEATATVIWRTSGR